MSRWALVGVGLAALVGAGQLHLQAEQPASVADRAESSAATARALLDRYCVTCHNERTRTAGLTLDEDTMDVSRVGEGAAIWEHVVRRLRADAMPPAGRPRPDAGAVDSYPPRMGFRRVGRRQR